MTNVIGIDVGKFGCLVSLSDPNNYLLMPMMEDTRDGVSLIDVSCWVMDFIKDEDLVCIERQWTFGCEGRVSIANLMLQYGQLLGYFNSCHDGLRIIPVAMWKKYHGVSSKQDAIDLVGKIYPDLNWPKLKPHRHGLADAILIALYGRENE